MTISALEIDLVFLTARVSLARPRFSATLLSCAAWLTKHTDDCSTARPNEANIGRV